MARISLGLLLITVFTQLAPGQATQPNDHFTAYPNGIADLHSPGFHKLIYEWNDAGKIRQICFSIYLPHVYGTDNRKWPMVTFLAGLGDRGTDPGNAMGVGVPLEIGRSPELGDWMPMIVLSPQCPSQTTWDAAGMAQDILHLIDAVKNSLPVDATRLYATGFSDGGKGSWILADQSPRLFAAIAPIVSKEYQADDTAKHLAGKGVSCLVLSGMKDEKSEPASSHMVSALQKQGVDVVYAPIPDAGHFIWRAFYSQRPFYEWLLLHHRDQPPPRDGLDGKYFVDLYQSHLQLSYKRQSFEYALQHQLDLFEPYWFIDNCAQTPAAGLRSEILGRKHPYFTNPLAADIPCRIQSTRQLPKDKITTLALEVGHPPKGEWELVIRVNEQEQLRKKINDETAPDGWLTLKLNLQAYAGSEARLQLIQNAVGQAKSTGYWSSIKLIETPQDSPPK